MSQKWLGPFYKQQEVKVQKIKNDKNEKQCKKPLRRQHNYGLIPYNGSMEQV